MDRYINAPLTDEDAQSLRAGDYVYITGTIYTARDAAHLRMYEALEHGEPLPVEMAHNIIYTWDHRPPGTVAPSAPQVPRQPAVWINTHRNYSILA